MTAIVTARIGPTGYPLEIGYVVGFTVMGVVMALAAFATVWMPDLRVQPTSGLVVDADNAELGLVPGAGALGGR